MSSENGANSTVCILIQKIAALHPRALAVESGEFRLTYEQLHHASQIFAQRLARYGIQKSNFVACHGTRSPAMLVAILGVLKAGACLVPIDADTWGRDRIAKTLKIAATKLIVSTTETMEPAREIPIVRFPMKDLTELLQSARGNAAMESSQLPSWPNGDDLAYTIFTSGTTGTPKGVMIRHSSLAHYVHQYVPHAPFNLNARIGSRVLLVYSSTCASLIKELVPGSAPNILEHTISQSIVILLTDGDGGIGEEGEILISGPGLAVGYLGNKPLTSSKFKMLNGVRYYCTGDYGRKVGKGIQFMGRKDRTVKNRGFLINLDSEVEQPLAALDGVRSAAAFMHNGHLVAFVTPETVDVAGIKSELQKGQDAFVIPERIYAKRELALTSNGKVDIATLRGIMDSESFTDVPGTDEKKEKDETEAYTAVKKGFSEILNVPIQHLNGDSSFLGLGGNSLSAVGMVSYIRRERFACQVHQIFQGDTISEISTILSRAGKTIAPQSHLPTTGLSLRKEAIQLGIDSTDNRTIIPMRTIQLKMIQSTLMQSTLNYIKVDMAFKHEQKAFDTTRFHEAWSALCGRHSILRLRFVPSLEVAIVHKDSDFEWTESSYSSHLKWREAIDLADRNWTKELEPLHIDRLYLRMKLSCYIYNNHETRFSWVIHHSLIDGWSVPLILHELGSLLNGKPLPPAQEFATAVNAQHQICNQPRSQAVQLWMSEKDNLAEVPKLELPKPHLRSHSGNRLQFARRLGISLSDVRAFAKRCLVSDMAVFLTAWGLVLSKYCNSNRVVCGAVLSGRDLPVDGVERIVGPLLSTVAVSMKFFPAQTTEDAVFQVHKILHRINEVQWEYEKFASELPRPPVIETLVSLQYGVPDLRWPSSDQFPSPQSWKHTETNELPFHVLVDIDQTGGLEVRFMVDADFCESFYASRLLDHYVATLRLLPVLSTVSEITRSMVGQLEINKLLYSFPELKVSYRGATSLKDAFEAAADSWPDLVALETVKESYTYSKLDMASNTVAASLAKIAGPGDVVAILADGSPEWIIAILAVLKVGASYCPVDISLPTERLETILAESQIKHLLKSSRESRYIGTIDLVVWTVKEMLLEADSVASAVRPPTLSRGKDPAVDAENPMAHLNAVDATMCTPSFLSTLDPSEFPNLSLVGRLDCTISAVYPELRPNKPVTLGRPVARMAIYVLDDHLCPCPVGVTGEIYLSGIQVTKGYLNLDKETRERFIANPWIRGWTMYKSGDRGRITANLEIECLGRCDNQVKIRGYRIELEEIESAVLSVCTDVIQAVVVPHLNSLIAFVSPSTVQTAEAALKLKGKLPSYCQPSTILAVDNMPTTANQKIDRRGLASSVEMYLRDHRLSVVATQPTTVTEKTIQKIWKEVTGCQLNEIGRLDRFTQIGGHSLLYQKVIRKIYAETGIRVPFLVVVEKQILSDLASSIDAIGDSQQKLMGPIPVSTKLPNPDRGESLTRVASHLEREMYLVLKLASDPAALNMVYAARIEGLNIEAFSAAISSVISSNEFLRLKFMEEDGRIVRQIQRPKAETVAPKLVNNALVEAETLAHQALDPGESLMKTCLLRDGSDSTFVVVIMSHLIGDRATLSETLAAVGTCYNDIVDARTQPLPPQMVSTDSYCLWAQHQEQLNVSSTQSRFWAKFLEPCCPRNSVFGKFDASKAVYTSLIIEVDEATTTALRRIQTEESLSGHQLVTALIGFAVADFKGRENLLVAAPFRDSTSISVEDDRFGLFLDRVLIPLQFGSAADTNIWQMVKEASEKAIGNFLPLVKLKQSLGLSGRASALCEIMITYHDQPIPSLCLRGTQVHDSSIRPRGIKFPLLFEVSKMENTFRVDVDYDAAIISPSEAEQIAASLSCVLQSYARREPPRNITVPGINHLHAADLQCQLENFGSQDTIHSGVVDTVRAAMAKCMGLDSKDVGASTSFFDIGATSMDSLLLRHLLMKEGLDVTLGAILSLGTARAIAGSATLLG
uniref:Two-module nonribosomal peptide synthetase n=1 Tax=Cordyceps militaris TaxID=73501 RepID=J3SIE0_CORMI|nr:two-module nonribosomal peptide synthetase [Cordyceps militaris]